MRRNAREDVGNAAKCSSVKARAALRRALIHYFAGACGVDTEIRRILRQKSQNERTGPSRLRARNGRAPQRLDPGRDMRESGVPGNASGALEIPTLFYNRITFSFLCN